VTLDKNELETKRLEDNYLEYPKRSYGMDHDLYDWSMLSERKPVQWPNDKKLVLWVNLNLQFFPLNQQNNAVAVPGGMKMPYPDLRHFSLRDYGNRVGVYRLFKALDKYGVKPTIAINGSLVERAPYLMDMVKERGDEVIAHGWQMDMLHTGDLTLDTENKRIQRCIETLQNRFKKPINGWLSPGRLQTKNTPELLAQNDITYMCDWVNDDMPYVFNTQKGELTALSLSNELDDFFILSSNLHSENSYAEQIEDACDFLLEEAKNEGGRILALNVHPWLLGQPHRISAFEQILKHITSNKEVWSASAQDIVKTWKEQQ